MMNDVRVKRVLATSAHLGFQAQQEMIQELYRPVVLIIFRPYTTGGKMSVHYAVCMGENELTPT
jgi:hypothetical protein